MNQIEKAVHDAREIIKRRKRILIIIPILMLLLGITVSYMVTPKYHSSISILVQKEETLNPLILYEMAVNLASDDRLKSFNEIIYSRTTIEMLIDTLQLDVNIANAREKQALIERIQKNIQTSFRASDSFDITYYDSEPRRAQQGVEILANYFINKRLSMENRRNEQTVEFFMSKLNELEEAVSQRRENILELQKRRLEETPNDNTALRIQMQGLDRDLQILQQELVELNRINDNLAEVSSNNMRGGSASSMDIEKLHNLSLLALPYTEDLSEMLREYDEMKQMYTAAHPSMQNLSSQITDLVLRMPPAISSEIAVKEIKIQDLTDQREIVLASIQESAAASRIDEGAESDYSIYSRLYDEMKVKLEQAKVTRDLGRKAADQFIVIDPPFYPEKPTSPNRPLIIIGSLLVGFFLASVTIVAVEVLDSTIRTEEDIIGFDKPIIAFITDGEV
ncbi:GumC family protein [Balneola sp. MJW-20]|uniref:GumC family protein n=1 Tax=Gracilimonas aurantiaca TaxID=3234185 RepID=UPI0034671F89